MPAGGKVCAAAIFKEQYNICFAALMAATKFHFDGPKALPLDSPGGKAPWTQICRTFVPARQSSAKRTLRPRLKTLLYQKFKCSSIKQSLNLLTLNHHPAHKKQASRNPPESPSVTLHFPSHIPGGRVPPLLEVLKEPVAGGCRGKQADAARRRQALLCLFDRLLKAARQDHPSGIEPPFPQHLPDPDTRIGH